MWGNIVTIHGVLKKNYKVKSTKTILKKKNKEKKFIKKIKIIMQGNIIVIHNVLKKKTTEVNFQSIHYKKKSTKII